MKLIAIIIAALFATQAHASLKCAPTANVEDGLTGSANGKTCLFKHGKNYDGRLVDDFLLGDQT